jgi:hypothetical protein
MFIGLLVMYRFFLLDLKKLDSSRQIFEEYSNIKFNENPSGGSQVVPCGRTDDHTDMTKLNNIFFAVLLMRLTKRSRIQTTYKQTAIPRMFTTNCLHAYLLLTYVPSDFQTSLEEYNYLTI